MFLYKLEAVTSDQLLHVVILAETDEQAFAGAESQLVRHYVAPPVIEELVIVEKKRAEKGAGYVLEPLAAK
ncbi:DUF3906 family protein [Gorillibacterium timonense]|uniref:DUF3906 family protein n=1 Tax=Gorillibacterium timonense TaxID=1689269 RepID=UPI00071DC47D|nr:DUF3906 family protein [Gorillibacterium timonense]